MLSGKKTREYKQKEQKSSCIYMSYYVSAYKAAVHETKFPPKKNGIPSAK